MGLRFVHVDRGVRALPGHELVSEGVQDPLVPAVQVPEAALVVAMAAPRLRAVGVDVPRGGGQWPSHRLYALLSRSGADAHSRVQRGRGRVVSFARAALQRPPVDAARIGNSLFGSAALRGRVRVYRASWGDGGTLRGGGPRRSTSDVRFEPESDALLPRARRRRSGWGSTSSWLRRRDLSRNRRGGVSGARSCFLEFNVDVHHFDPYSQALSKIERGFVHDLADVEAMLERALSPGSVTGLGRSFAPSSLSSSAIRRSPAAFARKVGDALGVEGIPIPVAVSEGPANTGFFRLSKEQIVKARGAGSWRARVV